MISLEVKVQMSAETQALLALLQDTPDSRHSINDAVGMAAADLTRAHLRDLDDKRHRSNVARRFYASAAALTTYEILDDGPTVRITKPGMAQRRFGGVIRAYNYSHLWIPVDPESEGKTAGEFKDLIAIINPETNRGVGLRTTDDKVLFALVTETKPQDPDPSVLPTDKKYQTAAATAIDLLLKSKESA